MSTTADQHHIRHPDRFFIGGEWVEPVRRPHPRSRQRHRGGVPLRRRGAGRRRRPRRGGGARGVRPRPLAAHVAQGARAAGSRRSPMTGRSAPPTSPTPGSANPASCMPSRSRRGESGSDVPLLRRPRRHLPVGREAHSRTACRRCWCASRSASSARSFPWNGAERPDGLQDRARRCIAGCTVIIKASPEAPAAAYILAEICEKIGLPPGVVNIVTADREVSERLVRHPGVDKITFTGSTAAGRRIASICGERIARCTLELGGKSPAIILDDYDLDRPRKSIAQTREVPHRPGLLVADPAHRRPRERHDDFVDALAADFAQGQGRRSVRPGVRDGAAGDGAPARPRRGLYRQGQGRRRARWRPAAAVRRISTAAISSSRRCSAMSTTPRPSPARRSSGRC